MTEVVVVLVVGVERSGGGVVWWTRWCIGVWG